MSQSSVYTLTMDTLHSCKISNVRGGCSGTTVPEGESDGATAMRSGADGGGTGHRAAAMGGWAVGCAWFEGVGRCEGAEAPVPRQYVEVVGSDLDTEPEGDGALELRQRARLHLHLLPDHAAAPVDDIVEDLVGAVGGGLHQKRERRHRGKPAHRQQQHRAR